MLLNYDSYLDLYVVLLEEDLNLLILYLSKNEISDISYLKNMNFPKLNVLSLDYNKIKNIRPLLFIKNLGLSSLNISHNKFRPFSSDNRTIIENLENGFSGIRSCGITRHLHLEIFFVPVILLFVSFI